MGFLKKHEGWFPYHLCIERFRLEFAQIHLSPPGNCLEIRVKCLICSNHREVSRRFRRDTVDGQNPAPVDR